MHKYRETGFTNALIAAVEIALQLEVDQFLPPNYRTMPIAQSAIKSSVRPSVCLLVTLIYRVHIGCTSLKLISRLLSFPKEFCINCYHQKRCFSSKCTTNRLAAGFRPDRLGELTALTRPRSWTKGGGAPRMGEKGEGRRERVR